MKLASWSQGLFDVLLPAGCVACRAWVPGRENADLVCAPCRSRLREAPWPRCPRCHYPRGTGRSSEESCLECRLWSPALTAARYAYVLAPPADDLVHSLKYEGWPELADLMGEAVSLLGLPEPGPADRCAVVPVPTTPRRLRRRGYNQAKLLAERVAEARKLPLYDVLVRARDSRSQTALSPEERRANVRGVFRASERAARLVSGAHVVLVDDVLTTGATASEAASVLEGSGAASVTLATFARALPSSP